jgi:adenylate cyclase
MPSEFPSAVKFEIGHVLFIDIVEYSKLLITEQSEQLKTLRKIVRGAEQFRVTEAEGKLLRLPTGDGGALVFRTTPEAAVVCALEVSKELKKHPELRVRMGIHSGPVNEITDLNEQANIAGAGINIAQRVMDCGDSGHILLSKHVAEDLEHYPRWQPYLHDLGECEVKHGVRVSVVNLYTDEVGNAALPTRLTAQKRSSATGNRFAGFRTLALAAIIFVGLGVPAIIFTPAIVKSLRSLTSGDKASSPSIREKSIAVLPFVDLSQAHDQEYFCDGISEEILDALAKVEGLRVVARTSSFSFKGKNADVGEIAQKLNVQNILEGSLRREGNRVRITAQLVDAHNGFHVWSDTFERELQGLFAVQDEITRSIVDALKVKLAVAPSAHAPENTEAHDLYLQGLYLSNKSDEESLRKSLSLFQRALDKDPTYARAWTGIAKDWLYLADAYVRPLDAYPKVREAASKALALDEQDPEAHCYLGEAKRVLDRDVDGEEAEVNRALQLDRNSASAHLFLAFGVHAERGEWENAVVEMRKAEKLDPLSPAVSNWLAWAYVGNGQIDDAIRQAERTLQLDANYMYRDPILATAYREKGDYARAISLYKKTEEATGIPQAGLAITYAKMGRQSDARQILDELKKLSATKYVAADVIASIYVALGEKDEAFRWMERAFEQYAAVNYLWSEFRPLRADPRFADLLRRTGVDPAKALARQKNPGI